MKDRLDKILTDRKLVTTRSQAKSMIQNGDVRVNGRVLLKAGELIDLVAEIEVTATQFVGRGALKLERALAEFSPDVVNKILLDIGASTGGFTEVLLLEGAQKVYAIDVGHGQLAKKLLDDPRVVNLEKTNIRDLSGLPDLADGGVMDLSFISVTKVLGTVRALIKDKGFLIVLIKPQFEVGREKLPKDGVVKDRKDQVQALEEVIASAKTHGWLHHGTIDSPIEGKAGNREFLCYFTNG
ncbi:MAG TPA: TlyA family RNA methyltransferase [Bacteriovoracaceae bacterium]|nr:TlyA family RNA methyltransferase [Bacteriovoracaceae bacterium]